MKPVIVGLLLLLSACAAPPAKGPQRVNTETLQARVQELPGAELIPGKKLQFSYPDGVMFGAGAVLPFPGGPQLLDPLADFQKSNPGLSWTVFVRARTAHGADYDQSLAEKRSELLATYLLSKGVDLQQLEFRPEAKDGDPLVFVLQTGS